MSDLRSGALHNIVISEYGWRKAKRRWGPKMQKVVVYQVAYALDNTPIAKADVGQERIGR